MDLDNISNDTRIPFASDSVEWQGSQTACAALDSLLSEATFVSDFQSSRDFAKETSRNHFNGTSFAHASTSSSGSSHSFAIAEGSSRQVVNDTRSSRSSALNNQSPASSWSGSSDHRARQSRPSASPAVDAQPVVDPDQFLSMLKGISQRIDGGIRSDASTSRDSLRRRPPSKRIASSSGPSGKRAKHDVLVNSSIRSVSESSGKGKGREVGAWSCTSTNTDPLVGSSVGRPKSRNGQSGGTISNAMEVDPPSSSCEIMPPPPVPPLKAKPPAVASSFIHSLANRTRKSYRPLLPSGPASQPKLSSQSRDPPSTPTCPSAPSSTPKLHPLLDTERKKRRLKLERTISASLASSPAESSSTSNSSLQIDSPAPTVHRHQSNRHNLRTLPLSQNRVVGNASRLPPLGMRRTHTFPSTPHKPSIAGVEPKASLPTKQKSFRPPVLSSSQPPPSTPSATSSSRSTVPSSHSSERTFASSKTSPPTSTDTPSAKSGDEEMEDLPPSSDADISFGDAISLDVDMDALEETMRKYD
ncbi:hypothetical protein D9756_007023 [Leucocoprinus leucothites]|uniref:Uncharacterized protein n=1 Tax=Leucocoprinus leucothites TaxID=201217 RepID=A0A8H5D6R9_9AGAR|nr:hypothetical protein D9756_007023 [Leucoagaricus leucothites]